MTSHGAFRVAPPPLRKPPSTEACRIRPHVRFAAPKTGLRASRTIQFQTWRATENAPYNDRPSRQVRSRAPDLTTDRTDRGGSTERERRWEGKSGETRVTTVGGR